MCYWILPETGIPISCTTVQRMPELDKQDEVMKEKMKVFDQKVKDILDVQDDLLPEWSELKQHQRLALEEDPEFLEEFNRVISDSLRLAKKTRRN